MMHFRMRFSVAGAMILTFVGVVLFSPSGVSAQACLARPIGSGQFAVTGLAEFTDGATGYSGSLIGMGGPISMGVAYTLTDAHNIDPHGHTIGGQLGAEVPGIPFSLCPVMGVSYSWFEQPITDGDVLANGRLTSISVPLGIGAGFTFHSPGTDFGVTLFGIPQASFSSNTLKVTTAATGGPNVTLVEETESQTEFVMSTGMVFSITPVFFGGLITVSTADDSEPVFGAGIGFVLGNRR